MMPIKLGLLRFFLRQSAWVMLAGALVSGSYALGSPAVMKWNDPLPTLGVLAYCLAQTGSRGRFQSRGFAFLYSRGFSRDVLWGHLWLATGVVLLAVWLPGAAVIWTGLRSSIHDRVFQSPNFPIMAPRETMVPLVWLAMIVPLLAAFHYAWIRLAQPTRGRAGGFFVPAAVIFTGLTIFGSVYYLPTWFAWLAGAAAIVATAAMLIGGRIIHRSLEVPT